MGPPVAAQAVWHASAPGWQSSALGTSGGEGADVQVSPSIAYRCHTAAAALALHESGVMD